MLKKGVFLLICLLHLGGYAQTQENKPTPKLEIDPKSKIPLLLPKEKNPLPGYLNKDFFSNTPNPNEAPKSFENQSIQMEPQETFIDPGAYYLNKLQKPEAEKNPSEFQVDQYLGDFKSSSENLRIVFRDHEYPDGDRILIRFNNQVLHPNILLKERYQKMDVALYDGFNIIEFVALNQGDSGPNTAEMRVYDEDGKLMMAKQWNLATGNKASFIVVKE